MLFGSATLPSGPDEPPGADAAGPSGTHSIDPRRSAESPSTRIGISQRDSSVTSDARSTTTGGRSALYCNRDSSQRTQPGSPTRTQPSEPAITISRVGGAISRTAGIRPCATTAETSSGRGSIEARNDPVTARRSRTPVTLRS